MDLEGISGVTLKMLTPASLSTGFTVGLYLDKPNGKILGEKQVSNIKGSKSASLVSIPFTSSEKGFHKIYIVTKPLGDEKNHPRIESLTFTSK
jgi:hypothetical protein